MFEGNLLFLTVTFILSIAIFESSFATTNAKKSFRKYITLFLCKIQSIGKLSKGTVLCTVKGVGLYPNILHTKRIALFWDYLDKRTEK